MNRVVAEGVVILYNFCLYLRIALKRSLDHEMTAVVGRDRLMSCVTMDVDIKSICKYSWLC